ncbi:MAG TPA: cytidine deaminase [Chthoniobacterales bacterium]|jgi:cytidine deaminase
MGTEVDLDFLAARAWKARENAYAKYSHFAVGAALATSSGEIFVGCNVENASFGLTICAERVAVSSAIVAGHREFEAIAVAAETEEPVVPCGACRQFLAEFNRSMRVCCIGRGGASRTVLLSDLLPSPFSSFAGS